MKISHRPNIWVVRYRNRFSVKEEGTRRYLVPSMPQHAAIRIARLLARANHSELFIQSRTGRIQSRDSHGFDNRRRKG